MPTAPPSITALPSPPDPNNRSTFNALAYPWSVAQQTLATEVGAVAQNVFENSQEAHSYAQSAVESASVAAAAAQTAVSSSATTATSSTSMSVSVGSKSFSLSQTGKQFVVGQYVQIVSTASTSNYMVGAITGFNSGSGAITVYIADTASVGGSGTYSAWTIVPSTPVPSSGMRLIASVTPINGHFDFSVLSIPQCKQIIVVAIEVGESGTSGIGVKASSNGGLSWSSGYVFDSTGSTPRSGVCNIYGCEYAGKKLFTSVSLNLVSEYVQVQEVPGAASVNALQIYIAGGGSFTGTGIVQIYGLS